jgi:hypothetical protein
MTRVFDMGDRDRLPARFFGASSRHPRAGLTGPPPAARYAPFGCHFLRIPRADHARSSPPPHLYDKIWDAHLVDEQPDGTGLLYIDRHLVHEVTRPRPSRACA